MRKYDLSLVIPCFNEAQGISELIDKCKELVGHGDIEVILVDNGSTDLTYEQLIQHSEGCESLKVIRLADNLGYGGGILQGLNVASGRLLGWSHADLQSDPRDVLIGYEKIVKSQSPLIFAKGLRYGRPFFDLIFTIGMSVFESILFLKPIWDVNAQPTVMTRQLYEAFDNPPSDFSLDLFAFIHALRSQATFVRFPVYFGRRPYGQSKWNIGWWSKCRFIVRTLKFSLDLRFKKY